MGVYHEIYAEVKVGNKWYSLNPLRPTDNGYKVMPIIQGQSYLQEAFEELEEASYMQGRPDDMSSKLREAFPHDDNEELDYFPRLTYKSYYAQTMFLVNYGKKVRTRYSDTRSTRFCGYAPKWSVSSFEIGESERINCWISEAEYKKLPKAEQEEFTYYEWNEFDDWYTIYGQICKSVECLLSWFREWAWSNIKDVSYDESQPSGESVRLICIREW